MSVTDSPTISSVRKAHSILGDGASRKLEADQAPPLRDPIKRDRLKLCVPDRSPPFDATRHCNKPPRRHQRALRSPFFRRLAQSQFTYAWHITCCVLLRAPVRKIPRIRVHDRFAGNTVEVPNQVETLHNGLRARVEAAATTSTRFDKRVYDPVATTQFTNTTFVLPIYPRNYDSQQNS